VTTGALTLAGQKTHLHGLVFRIIDTCFTYGWCLRFNISSTFVYFSQRKHSCTVATRGVQM